MKSKLLVPCLLVVVVASTPLIAQDKNQKPSDRPMPAAGGQSLFVAGMGPIGAMLTEEQRGSFRQAMEAQRDLVRDTEMKLRDARKKLLDASVDPNFEEAAARKHALAVATLEAELSVVRAKALSRVQPPLSAEQIEKIKKGVSPAPRTALPPAPAGERRHNLISTNRDENDLPRK